jgi:hypothetical protein
MTTLFFNDMSSVFQLRKKNRGLCAGGEGTPPSERKKAINQEIDYNFSLLITPSKLMPSSFIQYSF